MFRRAVGRCCLLTVGVWLTRGTVPRLQAEAGVQAGKEHAQAGKDDAGWGIDLSATEQKFFRVFTGDGRAATLGAVRHVLQECDVVLVGETHDDAVAHQLELWLLLEASRQESLQARPRRVVLSLEMLERDVQHVLDEYLAGVIRPQDLYMDGRVWNNYPRDYAPMVEFCKRAQHPVVAANAPRRYVSVLGRGGQLPGSACPFLPPLPLPTPSAAYVAHVTGWIREEETYAIKKEQEAKLSTPGSGSHSHTASQAAAAQEADTEVKTCPYIGLASDDSLLLPLILWDATMANSIIEYCNGSSLVLHIAGSFHVEFGLGIQDFLNTYAQQSGKPSPVVAVITIFPEEDFTHFDQERHAGAGDFVILTDGNLPRSFDIEHPGNG